MNRMSNPAARFSGYTRHSERNKGSRTSPWNTICGRFLKNLLFFCGWWEEHFP